MKRLLFIDATVRGPEESRTWQLCSTFLEELKKKEPDWDIRHLVLREEDLRPNTMEDVEARKKELSEDNLKAPGLKYALEFAEADRILIAAPYWDLSFPAILKIYTEKLCVPGITFRYTPTGVQALCKADRCIYLTTCGGEIGPYDYGTEYIRGVCKMLFGITDFYHICAEKLDIEGEDVPEIMRAAKNRVREMVANEQF